MAAKPETVEIISCDICLKDIPESVSLNAEADEYVFNFCGIECYQQWNNQQSANAAEETID